MPTPSTNNEETFDHEAIAEAIESIVAGVVKEFSDDPSRLRIVGIARGGISLAHRMAELLEAKLKVTLPVGQLDIAFQRDDIGTNPIPVAMGETRLPFDVNNSNILLVDDVLFTGRTVRAALNELFDSGRPKRVRLAILYDRGGRSLPIHADYCGIHRELPVNNRVEVALDLKDPKNDRIRISQPAQT